MSRILFAPWLAALIVAGPVSIAAISADAPARNEPPVTLSNAVRLALANHPSLAAARHEQDAAVASAHQARRWTNPELEFSSEDIPTDGSGWSEAQNMIGLSQTFPFPGRKRLDAQIGGQAIAQAEAACQLLERGVVRDVTAAFHEALAAEQRLAVSHDLLALAESLNDAARKRVDAGAAGRQEHVRAEIESERARLAVVTAGHHLESARATLASAIGMTNQVLGALQGRLREKVMMPDLARLREEALSRHPAILAARAADGLARLELRRAAVESRPDLTLGVAAGRDGAEDENIVAVRASLPLPLFDRSQDRRRAARALVESARSGVAAAGQGLLRDLHVAWTRYEAAREQVDSYRTRILPKADEAMNLVRGGFESGKFGFLDLVDTQRTTAESRLEYLDVLLEMNLAIAEVESLANVELTE
jgi:cobalt-zinc-cadmium efflux system outer membrane protein